MWTDRHVDSRHKGVQRVAERVKVRGGTQPMRIDAHVAQSVEHFLGKEEVTGSNPVVGFLNSAAESRARQEDTTKRIRLCEI